MKYLKDLFVFIFITVYLIIAIPAVLIGIIGNALVEGFRAGYGFCDEIDCYVAKDLKRKKKST